MDNEKIVALKQMLKIGNKHCVESVSIISKCIKDEYERIADERRGPDMHKLFFKDEFDSYNALLESGMFFELFPDLTGNWTLDHCYWIKRFIKNLE